MILKIFKKETRISFVQGLVGEIFLGKTGNPKAIKEKINIIDYIKV